MWRLQENSESYLETEQYPLPRPEDLMACLMGGYKFTKLDLSAAC